ncbi:phosphotransferase [Candidatus Haloredivivus sp. G17]|jgi:aminoglycoside phosphotransferase (APT) family kinase protein|nr:phosphotransferase [Candidatus Haloredivivus sp. G17]
MNEELKDRIEDKYGSLRSLDSDSVGMAHDIFFLEFQDGKEMVLKVGGEDLGFRFEREPYVLDWLADANLSVPEVVEFEINRGEEELSYLLMDKIEGQNINSYSEGRKFKFLSERAKEKLVNESAKQLNSIHNSTSYPNFGAFRAKMEKQYESNRWSETLLQILRKNELGGIEKGEFSHLHSKAESFLKENLSQLNTDSRPVMVHQDFSFKNMIVQGGEIRAVIDWERAISGHRELDLFKFERSISSKFRTKSIGEKYGELLIQKYQSEHSLESGWEERRNIYMLISLLQTMWTYDDWSKNIPQKIRKKIKENMEKEFENRVSKRQTDIFQHME